MSAQSTPIGIDLSLAAEKRHQLAALNWSQLQHLAYRALHIGGKRNDEYVIVCIEVDSRWRPLVDILMPSADWQQYCNKGERSVARGSVSSKICTYLTKEFPDLESVLMEIPKVGKMKCIVLDDGGCIVYDIDPVEQK